MFSEVDPGQKERIVAALRAAGHVVAYLGDGINDAPALRAADVGLSVDSAADVAREAADRVDEASVRTRAPFWRSRPGTGVLVSTVVIAGVAVGLPYTAPGRLFGFAPMPLELLAAVLAITCAYIVATEVAKQWFFRSRPS